MLGLWACWGLWAGSCLGLEERKGGEWEMGGGVWGVDVHAGWLGQLNLNHGT